MKPGALTAYVERRCELTFGAMVSEAGTGVLHRSDTQNLFNAFIAGELPCFVCFLHAEEQAGDDVFLTTDEPTR